MGKLVIKVHGGQELVSDDGVFLRCRYKHQEADTPPSRKDATMPSGTVVWRALLNFDVDDRATSMVANEGRPDLLHLEVREEGQNRLIGATALDMRDIITQQMNVAGQSYTIIDMANQVVGQIQCDIRFTLLTAAQPVIMPASLQALSQQQQQLQAQEENKVQPTMSPAPYQAPLPSAPYQTATPSPAPTAPPTYTAPVIGSMTAHPLDVVHPTYQKTALPQGFSAYAAPLAPALPMPNGASNVQVLSVYPQQTGYATQGSPYSQQPLQAPYATVNYQQQPQVMMLPPASVTQPAAVTSQNSGGFLGNVLAGVGDFLAGSMTNGTTTTEYYNTGYGYGSGNPYRHRYGHNVTVIENNCGPMEVVGHSHSSFGRIHHSNSLFHHSNIHHHSSMHHGGRGRR